MSTRPRANFKFPHDFPTTNQMPTLAIRRMSNFDKGEGFLKLSLTTLDELASLSEHEGLSASQKASYAEACRNGRTLSEETIRMRNRLLAQKKSFPKFLVNLFVRESSSKHFYRVSYRNYTSIKRTSDDLNRLWLGIDEILTNRGESAQGDAAVDEESLASANCRESAQGDEVVDEESLASANCGESAQGDEVVDEESLHNVLEDVLGLALNENTQGINLDVHTEQVQETRVANSGEDDEGDGSGRDPCDVVEGSHSAEGLSQDENFQDINLDVHTKQEVQEAFAIFDGLGIKFSREEDEGDDDDGSETSESQNRRL
ncbi:hypothetical protein CY34DRAFT_479909 [Suillus luteus UH-Slu-Lm8-n1]|uniref:Uncharacterized protein n=1 Tax=Suillus luteus UH-Slu-Lm8-n1 TaxID=930992 RepID=A0A0D0AYW7_9AGAM|nr:hypothetical protein CY34DRAFT_479909 [Suillus luteus UH-Slu-Lm8-n1]